MQRVALLEGATGFLLGAGPTLACWAQTVEEAIQVNGSRGVSIMEPQIGVRPETGADINQAVCSSCVLCLCPLGFIALMAMVVNPDPTGDFLSVNQHSGLQ